MGLLRIGFTMLHTSEVQSHVTQKIRQILGQILAQSTLGIVH